MSFLNALFLFALPLAATPLVLHMLRRRQRRVVSWGAMQFLTDAVGDGRRFDRLEEWLLLALRVLAVAALVLALARPQIVQPLGGEGNVARELVLVIDDSLSTSVKTSSGVAFEQIRKQAQSLLDHTPSDTDVRVMLAAEGPRWIDQQQSTSRQRLRGAIEKLQPTTGAANFLSCLRLAATFDAGREPLDRQVVVVTDNQAHGWRLDAAGVWARLGDAIKAGDRRVHVSVVPVQAGGLSGANYSVAVNVARSMASPQESVLFTATITNTGPAGARPASLVWAVNGQQRKTQRTPRLAPGESRKLEWRPAFDETGVYDVTAAINASDPLPADDRAGAVIEVLNSAPILILSEHLDPDAADTVLLRAALGYDQPDESEERQPWKSLYEPHWASYASVTDHQLKDYHVIVVSSLRDMPTQLIDRLEAYTREGGGLWVTLGARLARDDFNTRWHRDGTGLAPVRLASLTRPPDAQSAAATIHPPSGDHPATAMLADTRRLDIDRVRLRRYHTLERPSGDDLSVLLESGRGAPLAVAGYVGRGRTVFQAFPLTTDWSDVAISKSFAVMVQDWLSYLATGAATRYNLTPRETFVHAGRQDLRDQEARVTLPDGQEAKLKPAGRDGVVGYRFSQTALPGRYTLWAPGKDGQPTEIAFRVDRSEGESDLKPLSSEDILMLTTQAGVQFDGGAGADFKPDERRPAVVRSPAWWPLLFAMLCLMAAESLLASRVSRGRFAAA